MPPPTPPMDEASARRKAASIASPGERMPLTVLTAASKTQRLQAWWRNRRWYAGSLTYTTGGLFLLFFWLLGGDFGLQFKERTVQPTLQLLLGHFQASDFVTGLLLLSLPQAIGVVVNPVFGYLSDRHRGRWGRRIPFLLIPTPIAVIAMIGLAYAPAIGHSLHVLLGTRSLGENTITILILGIFWGVFEFCSVICYALLIALVTDVVPREVVGRFFALFRVVALASGILFNYYLLGRAEEHYLPIFLLMAAIYGISFTLMCLKVKEGEYPPLPPSPTGSGRRQAFMVGARSYLRDCLANPYYRWIFFASALGLTAMAPLNLYTIYYAKSLHMNMGTLGKYGAVMLFIALVQAYPIGWLVDRFHALRVTIVATVLLAVAAVIAFFTVRTPATFGIAYVVCGVISAFWVTAWWPLGPMLFPKEKFGAFNSVQLVVNALGQIVIAPLCGWSLDLLGHNYRYIYLWVAGLAILAIPAFLIVYRKLLTFGGFKAYAPPV